MRGVFINDTFPIIRMFENSLNGESILNFLEYEVKIKSNKGEEETMLNGKFSKMKTSVGVEYTVFWKLKKEIEWHTLNKTIPDPDTVNIFSPKLVTETDRLYFNNVETSQNDNFFWAVSDETLKDNLASFQNNNGMKLWSSADEKFMILKPIASKQLQVYPAEIWQKQIFFQPCLTPFNRFPENWLNNMTLVQCSKADMEIFKNITESYLKSDEPLYAGEPINWDYKQGNSVGHIFSYYKYEKIKLLSLIPKNEEAEVKYSLLYNNSPIDTNQIKIENVVYNFEGSINYISQSSKPKNQLFFKDYLASSYNYYFQKPCGYYLPQYKFYVSVIYTDKKNLRLLTYKTTLYQYSMKGFNININIQ